MRQESTQQKRKVNLLTQNSDLKKTGIFGWTIPAHWTLLPDGTRFNTCPNAGVCAAVCYAKSGTFMFSNVKRSHQQKLDLVVNHRSDWIVMMINEIQRPKYQHKFIRIHDAGDFFSRSYAMDWLSIARHFPDVKFYTYTKEVSMFKSFESEQLIPQNFVVIYSFGGREDHLIDASVDRHSDVFTNYDEMIRLGYIDISDDDSMAATSSNHRIGLYRNNIPHFIKRQGGKSFSEWSKMKSTK